MSRCGWCVVCVAALVGECLAGSALLPLGCWCFSGGRGRACSEYRLGWGVVVARVSACGVGVV